MDIVLERGAQALAGVEVKALTTVTASDFCGLRKLKETAGKRFTAGVVLYDGEMRQLRRWALGRAPAQALGHHVNPTPQANRFAVLRARPAAGYRQSSASLFPESALD